MAGYKVPQDVEADDKFLGPLSFKQFLFFLGVLVFGYLSFLTITKNAWFISPIFILPTIVFAFLAFPWSREQPTEIWLAARIRFFIKPRRRIWDQTGMKDLVTITVPKRPVHNYTDGLNQTQVQSRLSALASIVDTRGWAVKNYIPTITTDDSDRLIEGTKKEKSNLDVIAESTQDVLDEQSSVIAKQFENMITVSEERHRQHAKEQLQHAIHDEVEQHTEKEPHQIKKSQLNKEDFWFLHQAPPTTDPNLTTFQAAPVIAPGANDPVISSPVPTVKTDISDEELLQRVHEKQRRDALQTHGHEKNIHPIAEQVESEDKAQAVTTGTNPDILVLAKSNDLNVATLSRQANKHNGPPEGEVVVSLH